MEKLNITQRAHSEVYERGLAYHKEKRVYNIKKYGNRFQGDVRGSQKYLAQIKVSSDGISAFCNCPYTGNGWCKHLVALGLSIEEGNFQEEPQILAQTPTQLSDFPTLQQKLIHQQAQIKGLVPTSVLATSYLHPIPGDLLDIDYVKNQFLQYIQASPTDFGVNVQQVLYAPDHFVDVWGQYYWALQEMHDELGREEERSVWENVQQRLSEQLLQALQTHWIAPALALRFLQLLFTRKEVKIRQQTSTLSWLELSWLIEAFISDQVTAHYVQMKIDAYGLAEEAGFTRIQDTIDRVFALPSP